MIVIRLEQKSMFTTQMFAGWESNVHPTTQLCTYNSHLATYGQNQRYCVTNTTDKEIRESS